MAAYTTRSHHFLNSVSWLLGKRDPGEEKETACYGCYDVKQGWRTALYCKKLFAADVQFWSIFTRCFGLRPGMLALPRAASTPEGTMGGDVRNPSKSTFGQDRMHERDGSTENIYGIPI
ncbi:hypothetical protein NL676_018791 [Syzygium grande]|nr:hypothetical protein NL676_018791 [Syzygium grande]